MKKRSCPIGEIELYYEDGKSRKCIMSRVNPRRTLLVLTDKGFKCCVDVENKKRYISCNRITPKGNIRRGDYCLYYYPANMLDRFKLTFFKKQILEEVEKVRADANVA